MCGLKGTDTEEEHQLHVIEQQLADLAAFRLNGDEEASSDEYTAFEEDDDNNAGSTKDPEPSNSPVSEIQSPPDNSIWSDIPGPSGNRLPKGCSTVLPTKKSGVWARIKSIITDGPTVSKILIDPGKPRILSQAAPPNSLSRACGSQSAPR